MNSLIRGYNKPRDLENISKVYEFLEKIEIPLISKIFYNCHFTEKVFVCLIWDSVFVFKKTENMYI